MSRGNKAFKQQLGGGQLRGFTVDQKEIETALHNLTGKRAGDRTSSITEAAALAPLDHASDATSSSPCVILGAYHSSISLNVTSKALLTSSSARVELGGSISRVRWMRLSWMLIAKEEQRTRTAREVSSRLLHIQPGSLRELIRGAEMEECGVASQTEVRNRPHSGDAEINDSPHMPHDPAVQSAVETAKFDMLGAGCPRLPDISHTATWRGEFDPLGPDAMESIVRANERAMPSGLSYGLGSAAGFPAHHTSPQDGTFLGSAAGLPASAQTQRDMSWGTAVEEADELSSAVNHAPQLGAAKEEVHELVPVRHTAAGNMDMVESPATELEPLSNDGLKSILIDDALFSILPAPGQSWDDWESRHYGNIQNDT